jgi:hypothetical protein
MAALPPIDEALNRIGPGARVLPQAQQNVVVTIKHQLHACSSMRHGIIALARQRSSN